MKDDDDIATTNVNVESKMEVTAPVVKSPTPLPGPTQNVNETKVVEQEDDEGLGLDENCLPKVCGTKCISNINNCFGVD